MNIGIGPTNTAGQGYRLARALREAGYPATSFGLEDQHPAPLRFPCDRVLTRVEWGTPAWKAYVAGFSHLLMWNGFSPYGPKRWWVHELDKRARMAVVFRGSELRYPKVHRQLERWSPFRESSPLQDALRFRNDILRDRLRKHPPTLAYIATLEMLEYLPTARWLPIIAEPAEQGPIFERKPVVLHLSTNDQLKGGSYVDALRSDRYEVHRPALMWPHEALAAIADADVVIGGLLLGDYGGTEIQAMAAGRLVVGNISQRVRSVIPDLPIVQAEPDTLADVLDDIARKPDKYREIAACGPNFHARYHDGRYSVAQLDRFLDVGEVAA